MNYCQYCGAKLENELPCACEEAKKSRGEMAAPAETAPDAGTEPAAVDKEKTAAAEPSASGPSAGETAKKALGEAKNAVRDFAENPESAAKKDMGLYAAIILLAVEIIACAIMCGVAADAGLAWRGALYAALNIVVVYISFFIFDKIFRTKQSPQKLLSIEATASMPWSAFFILTAVLSQSWTEPPSLFAMFTLFVFAFIISICLIGFGLEKTVESGRRRMLFVSVSMSVAIAAFAYFIYSVGLDYLVNYSLGFLNPYGGYWR